MLDETQPITKLDAVNLMLSQIGASAVMSLADDDLNLDASRALQVLYVVAQDTLELGWHFNTEIKLVLEPDVNGEIPLPANTLRVDTVYANKQDDLVWRGSPAKLYDRVNHTTVIGKSVYVDCTIVLPFDQCPPVFRRFVAYSSARQFAGASTGNSSLVTITAEDEKRAWVALCQAEGDTDDRTMAQASPHVYRMRRR